MHACSAQWERLKLLLQSFWAQFPDAAQTPYSEHVLYLGAEEEGGGAVTKLSVEVQQRVTKFASLPKLCLGLKNNSGTSSGMELDFTVPCVGADPSSPITVVDQKLLGESQ
jgi:hypothetical protein